jgi:mevalonate kinase
MPAFSAYAPGKSILFGEHAVVYGRPAIAAPITKMRTRAQIEANLRAPSGCVDIEAPAIALAGRLDELPPVHPIAFTVRLVQEAIGATRLPACKIRITSTIPVASGLGSGAAAAVALIRALAAFLGNPLPDDQVCAMAFEVERLHHGTPSGIDNTVITYALPVFYIQGKPIHLLHVGEAFTIVIGDTGISSPTADSVAHVRSLWQAEPQKFENYFDRIAEIVRAARQVIEQGPASRLGDLLNANHDLLQSLGVSSPELDRLVFAARQAGALGAKLSGGGRGGNMIALAAAGHARQVCEALLSAGAVRTWISEVR